ncbi:uncharacterized protein LOC126838473 isoform X1 [Adelges cooleyi]|uniref:uncharacterized protein LOC126838473 isoform X1 n=1 Tax=Adelges cooleyi TaxID=133065 RepID=UPI00217F8EBE|nr:uncharacterized protein LOC126838473 isoform X1 [Adelges cooleyi]XP_050429015.1 uncharacterized protein LOC126838473 isoform X1 [Adelges cooleyi]XP_050429099.1 uncharacterized protein LOC126838473 isoform X1 [Adelges cooleyi]
MKLLCILISFALVGHVFVTQLDEYVKEVLITNDHIKLAESSMPTIIKNIVQKANVYGMVPMVYMMAVPEKIYSVLLIEESDHSDSDEIENPLIEASAENLSEDSIPLEGMEEKLEFQKMMQTEISAEAHIDAPTVNLENLFSLLEHRRRHTSLALRHRITRACLICMGIARREMTLEAIKSLIRQNDPLFSDFIMMCRLMGVFISIKYPDLYIETAHVNGVLCTLTNEDFEVTHVYKIIDGAVWQVDRDPDDPDQIRPFLSELE